MVLLLEPGLKPCDASFHLWRDLTPRLIHLRPGAAGEDLNTEVKIEIARAQVLLEFLLHVFRELHILEHLRHVVDLIGTALDLKLLNKKLLVLRRYA